MNVTCISYTSLLQNRQPCSHFSCPKLDDEISRSAGLRDNLLDSSPFAAYSLDLPHNAQAVGPLVLPKPPSWKLFCLLNLVDMFERIESGKSEESCIATLRGFNVSICELSAAFRLVCLFHDYF